MVRLAGRELKELLDTTTSATKGDLLVENDDVGEH